MGFRVRVRVINVKLSQISYIQPERTGWMGNFICQLSNCVNRSYNLASAKVNKLNKRDGGWRLGYDFYTNQITFLSIFLHISMKKMSPKFAKCLEKKQSLLKKFFVTCAVCIWFSQDLCDVSHSCSLNLCNLKIGQRPGLNLNDR